MTILCAREHDLTVHEDQQHHARFYHPIDQARKQFRLVRAELLVHLIQFLQPNRKAQVNGGHEILYLEVQELDRISELLDDSCEFACAEVGVSFRARTSTDHLAGAKNQGGAARLADAHDDAVKAGRVVLGIACAKVDLLQVEVAAETDG